MCVKEFIYIRYYLSNWLPNNILLCSSSSSSFFFFFGKLLFSPQLNKLAIILEAFVKVMNLRCPMNLLIRVLKA